VLRADGTLLEWHFHGDAEPEPVPIGG
jgi:hypothetical protein